MVVARDSHSIKTEVTSSWGTCCCGALHTVAATEPAVCIALVPADNLSNATRTLDTTAITFRTATLPDAGKIWQLVGKSGVLDENSRYCYLLLCRDFSETCVVACREDEIVGFVTAYRPPTRCDTVFVWQIGVAEQVRGQGVAKCLLHTLVSLPACREVRFLEATVTPSNVASRRLFESFAESLGLPCLMEQEFTPELFGDGGHEEEDLFRIGPFPVSPMEKKST